MPEESKLQFVASDWVLAIKRWSTSWVCPKTGEVGSTIYFPEDGSSTAIESDSSGTGAGFTSELSVTALSRSYLEADEVAQEVYDELVGHSDSTACIALITPTTITRDQEMPYDGSQDLVYRTTVEFSVVHGNPI